MKILCTLLYRIVYSRCISAKQVQPVDCAMIQLGHGLCHLADLQAPSLAKDIITQEINAEL